MEINWCDWTVKMLRNQNILHSFCTFANSSLITDLIIVILNGQSCIIVLRSRLKCVNNGEFYLKPKKNSIHVALCNLHTLLWSFWLNKIKNKMSVFNVKQFYWNVCDYWIDELCFRCSSFAPPLPKLSLNFKVRFWTTSIVAIDSSWNLKRDQNKGILFMT